MNSNSVHFVNTVCAQYRSLFKLLRMYQISPHLEVSYYIASICTLARTKSKQCQHRKRKKGRLCRCVKTTVQLLLFPSRYPSNNSRTCPYSVPKTTTRLEAKQSIHTRHGEETSSLQNTNEALETNSRLNGAHIPEVKLQCPTQT